MPDGGALNLGRLFVRELNRQSRWRGVYGHMQAEAAARPESKQVQTPVGPVWMSPIEAQLYQAMLRERLNPYPQFYIQGYYADFAFPDVGIAVVADGAVHQDPRRHEHDRKR